MLVAVLMAESPVLAASLPGTLHPLPNPPGAPRTDTFLVTIPHRQVIPTRAVFRFRGKPGEQSTTQSGLKKLNRYQYVATWNARSTGHLSVRILSNQNQLVAQGQYRVAKSKASPVGRILIGVVFIGVSLWFWWRQQRTLKRR